MNVFWLLRKLYFQAKFIFVKDMKVYRRSGFRLLLDAKSNVDRYIIRKGYWEKKQVAYLFDASRKLFGEERAKPIFLDVGSYIGWYSFKALESQIFAEIFAFEADPLNFAQLNLNVQLNGAGDTVRTQNIAISDQSGTITFRASTNDPKNRGLTGGPLESEHIAVEVDCLPLDEILAFEGKNLVIKIDVEGHEMPVVRGMAQLLERNRALLQVELWGGGRQAFIDHMEGKGFRLLHAIGEDHHFTNAPDAG